MFAVKTWKIDVVSLLRGVIEFDELGTRPIYAYVAKTNAASIRVLEKCGFVRSDEAEDLYKLA
jgi:L-amino acid N-acyltransferase YncA